MVSLSVTNNTKLERLHRAASRVITGCLSSSLITLLLYLPCEPPGLICLMQDRPGELFRPLNRSCFLLLLLGRLFLRALSFLLGTCLPSPWSPPFPFHAPALIPLPFVKVRLSPTLTLSPLTIWCSVHFGKGGSGVLANCSL